jgi:hypothetical protein
MHLLDIKGFGEGTERRGKLFYWQKRENSISEI